MSGRSEDNRRSFNILDKLYVEWCRLNGESCDQIATKLDCTRSDVGACLMLIAKDQKRRRV